ncbi:hypothetical protein SDC9_59212 [bioreactor metagenome]|uniref:Uncharacterized protein n=1 Tax=bioreactor metagenome TaxID=1076179 RepID=A0A644XAR7_9ZZZZ
MDLNERLEARRKELAREEERQRQDAQRQLEAERESQLQQQEAERQAWVHGTSAKADSPSKKVVDIDSQPRHFKQGLAEFTKKQWVIQCVLVVLFLIGVEKEESMMTWFWGICAVLYFCMTLSENMEKPTKSKTD